MKRRCSICYRFYDDSTPERRYRHFRSLAHLKVRWS